MRNAANPVPLPWIAESQVNSGNSYPVERFNAKQSLEDLIIQDYKNSRSGKNAGFTLCCE